MAKKNPSDVTKSAAELAEEAGKLKKELFDMHFKNTTRSLNDTMSMRRTRRQIARLLTAANAKKAAGT
ncbi:MAG: 50S ribosomal protein L29 [Deltaproteobacteria bacterium]|nr:50S ribosomal protein L29 [Deltaproteobacteria bacterium]